MKYVFVQNLYLNIVGVSATKELSAEKIPAKECGRHVKLLQIPQIFFSLQ